LATLTLSFCLYLIISIRNAPSSAPRAHLPQSSAVFQIGKLTSLTYNEGKLSESISFDKITVNSKKFGLFRVRNVNEMVIKNLAIEQIVYIEQKEETGDILEALQECLPGLKNSESSSSPLGRIAGITINGFSLKSSTTDGRILLACRARDGKLNNKSTQLELSHIVLRSPDSGRVISAKKGQWNQTQQRFEIEGEYLAQSPRGSTKGHGISVDLHYQLGKL
jgi:hypothetical protein